MEFRRLPSSDRQNVCEQRLLDWYKSMKTNLQNESNHFSQSVILNNVNTFNIYFLKFYLIKNQLFLVYRWIISF